MRLNVFTRKRRFLIDVHQNFSIWRVKEVIAEELNLNITPYKDKEGTVISEDYLHLFLNSTPLHNDCTVGEIGLKSGITLYFSHWTFFRRKLGLG